MGHSSHKENFGFKAKGKEKTAWLDNVNSKLPALQRAKKLQKRAAEVGFDWPDRKGVREKIREELDELEAAVGIRSSDAIEEEFGAPAMEKQRHIG